MIDKPASAGGARHVRVPLFIRVTVAWLRLVAGGLMYALTGRTPAFAHQAMVTLFCHTSGRSNDAISRVVALVDRPSRMRNKPGVLDDAVGSDLSNALQALRGRGYLIIPNAIPEDACARLLDFALSQPCAVRAMDGETETEASRSTYERTFPRAVRYDFSTRDLLDNPDIQALLADASFARLAQGYLGSTPKADVLSMWWHTAAGSGPDSNAAQFFHFDMDRPKWLKFFVYLTDVGTDNGPHSFVEGSHATNSIPQHLLNRGYARLPDEDVAHSFEGKLREITGLRGTLIVEDTRGLHKGKHVQRGDRLVLQLQFSNSLFGANYPKATLGVCLIPALEDAIRENPAVYAAYL